MFIKSKNNEFWPPRGVWSLIFWRYLRCFVHVRFFFVRNLAAWKKQKKKRKKIIEPAWAPVFGIPPQSFSQGPFFTVFAMFYAHRPLFKNEPFCRLREGVGGCGSMLRQRCLVASPCLKQAGAWGRQPGLFLPQLRGKKLDILDILLW